MRSECDLRPAASGSHPRVSGHWIRPDPEAGRVWVYDRVVVAHEDPALPQSQALPGLCGNEGTGNRARPAAALCSIPGCLPLVQQLGPPGGALGGGEGQPGVTLYYLV